MRNNKWHVPYTFRQDICLPNFCSVVLDQSQIWTSALSLRNNCLHCVLLITIARHLEKFLSIPLLIYHLLTWHGSVILALFYTQLTLTESTRYWASAKRLLPDGSAKAESTETQRQKCCTCSWRLFNLCWCAN